MTPSPAVAGTVDFGEASAKMSMISIRLTGHPFRQILH